MSRRLDIELTSVRDDGTWTWRAAGAKEPRGAIDAKLLENGAKVGDVVRVEASFDMDGITILSVLPPRERSDPKGRIEIVGAPNEGSGSVTTELVSRRRGVGRDRTEREGARPHRDEKRPRPGRPPRPEGAPDSTRRERPARVRPTRANTLPTEPTHRRAPERAERIAERPRRTASAFCTRHEASGRTPFFASSRTKRSRGTAREEECRQFVAPSPKHAAREDTAARR